jgi:hypothetical protein
LEILRGNPWIPDDPDYVHQGSFLTPLATLHKFNGWADKFLVTPLEGLSDLYFTAGGLIGPVKGLATFHLFTAAEGGEELGHELTSSSPTRRPGSSPSA